MGQEGGAQVLEGDAHRMCAAEEGAGLFLAPAVKNRIKRVHKVLS